MNALKDFAKLILPEAYFTWRKMAHIKRVRSEYNTPGTKQLCNICGKGFERFAPFHGYPNRMCPNCLSLERHRILYYYLSHETSMLSQTGGLSILHFAPEKSLYDTINSIEGVRYETADLMIQFMPDIEVEPKHKMSITDIEFPDESFDYFISNHVLEHVPNDAEAMQEIYRVLKPGGSALLQVPINDGATETLEDPNLTRLQRREQYGAQDHLRYYAKDDFADRLRAQGFTRVDALEFTDKMDPTLYSINPYDILFVCEK